MENTHFGEHITLDGYKGNTELLDSKELLERALRELPEKLGMHILGGPEVYRAEPNGIKDPGGWSGMVVIAESHISIHTFPGTQFLSADVYTCRNGMDTEFIKKYFTETWQLKDLETNFIIRGKKYGQ